MTQRERPERNFIGDTPFSAADTALIEKRRIEIILTIRERMLEAPYLLLARNDTVSQGGIMHHRQLGFAKIALINRGQPLVTHWNEIRAELEIPWQVHYWEAAPTAWSSVAGIRLESAFYRTRRDLTDEETALYDKRWLPADIPGMPGFGAVLHEEAVHFLGLIGGQHPHVDHPPISFRDYHLQMSGSFITVNLTRYVELGVAPFHFELLATDYTWASMTAEGVLTLRPPTETPHGDYEFALKVTDAEGYTATGTATISLVE